MTDEKIIKILSKVYLHNNQENYDFDKKFGKYKLPDNLREKDILLVESSGFEINKIQHYQHDNVVEKLKKIATENDFEEIAFNLFMRAIGSGFHRGLQTVVSYLYAISIPEHKFEPFHDEHFRNPCKICGLPKENWENDGKNLHDLYLGYCRIGGYTEMLLDLQEVLTFENIKATKNDIEVFKRLIVTIDKATENETPTDLLNRISKEKILPNSNNTSRTWLIRILAELGIMKNKIIDNYSLLNGFVPHYQILEWEEQLHNEAPNHRTEVNFPISAWRGKLGINHLIVEQILAIVEKTK